MTTNLDVSGSNKQPWGVGELIIRRAGYRSDQKNAAIGQDVDAVRFIGAKDLPG